LNTRAIGVEPEERSGTWTITVRETPFTVGVNVVDPGDGTAQPGDDVAVVEPAAAPVPAKTAVKSATRRTGISIQAV